MNIDEISKFNVMSSRIRLARNVEGLPFPQTQKSYNPNLLLELISGAFSATKNIFDSELF